MSKPIRILDEHIAAHVAELFSVFSDASRVRIVAALIENQLNVNKLAELIEISESAISHHLRHLRQMGIAVSKRDGKEVYYRIEDEHIKSLFNQGVNHIKKG